MKNTNIPRKDQAAWATVAAFPSAVEAQLAKCHLEGEGIPAFLRDEHVIGMNPLYSVALGGIRVEVPEARLERAREILGVGAPEPPVRCEACGGEGAREANAGRKSLALLAFLLAAVPFPVLREAWRCRRCGRRWRR